MAPTTRAAKKAALQCENPPPSLPLELWHLIFAQNTNPKHLWTVGRQVCSMWRSEIPKIMAKKYLEDPKMTQIHCDCEIAFEKSLSCLMGPKLIFSHYKDNKTRAVFKKCSEHEEDEDDHMITVSKISLARRRRKVEALMNFSYQARLTQRVVPSVVESQQQLQVASAAIPHPIKSESSRRQTIPSSLA
jgi:hypothetical protein